jgi:hypothetical protein
MVTLLIALTRVWGAGGLSLWLCGVIYKKAKLLNIDIREMKKQLEPNLRFVRSHNETIVLDFSAVSQLEPVFLIRILQCTCLNVTILR